MTIIHPNKEKTIWTPISGILGATLCLIIVAGVFLYSKTVALNYDIQKISDKADELRLTNAELKGQLLKATDPTLLEQLASEKGLIQDKNPQWVFASAL